MFSATLVQLRKDVETIKRVINVHETARGMFYGTLGEPDPWAGVRGAAPRRIEWQTYDHCAAFTRLYAIFSSFVEDLISQYLRFLPVLYPRYNDLPDGVLRQHRLGCAQILQKLGETGRYGHLTELELVKSLSSGVIGGSGYTLQREAFFTERQNYRLEPLGRLLAFAGIENGAYRISRHPSLLAFCEERQPEATSVESELNRFVQIRNEAAHSQVDEIVSVEEFKEIADFIVILGEAIAEIVQVEIVNQQMKHGRLQEIGTLTETFKGGQVGILTAKASALAVGDGLVVRNGLNQWRLVKVLSIQINGQPYESHNCVDGEEIGLGFDKIAKQGNVVFKLVAIASDQSAAPPVVQGADQASTVEETEDTAINDEEVTETEV